MSGKEHKKINKYCCIYVSIDKVKEAARATVILQAHLLHKKKHALKSLSPQPGASLLPTVSLTTTCNYSTLKAGSSNSSPLLIAAASLHTHAKMCGGGSCTLVNLIFAQFWPERTFSFPFHFPFSTQLKRKQGSTDFLMLQEIQHW